MADKKALELLKDKGFFEEMVKTGSAEEAQKLFASKGAEVSMEELSAVFARIKQKADAELSDEDLAAVAGGGIYYTAAEEAKQAYWTKDDWEPEIKRLKEELDALGTDTQQKMVFVQDFMGQYNSYLQGANSVIQQSNQTLAELARAR